VKISNFDDGCAGYQKVISELSLDKVLKASKDGKELEVQC